MADPLLATGSCAGCCSLVVKGLTERTQLCIPVALWSPLHQAASLQSSRYYAHSASPEASNRDPPTAENAETAFKLTFLRVNENVAWVAIWLVFGEADYGSCQSNASHPPHATPSRVEALAWLPFRSNDTAPRPALFGLAFGFMIVSR